MSTSQVSSSEPVDKIPEYYQQARKHSVFRFSLLFVSGIAAGIVLYLLIWGGQNKIAQPVAAAFPTDLASGLERGSQQINQKQLETAEQTFKRLAEQYPAFPQPYNNLAAVYALRGDLEESRKALEQAMATDPSYATVYRNLGTVYAEMARVSYGRALQLEKGQQAVTLQVFGETQSVALNDKANKTVATVEPPVAETDQPLAAEQVVVKNTSIQDGDNAGAADKEPDLQTTPSAETVAKPVMEESSKTSAGIPPQPESPEHFLERWAEAWSAQDVSSYLAFYADTFAPASGASREAWEKQRQTRLTRPEQIKVSLKDIQVVLQKDDQVQVELTQEYRSDRYQDRTRKSFDLIRSGESWRIVRERSLGRIR